MQQFGLHSVFLNALFLLLADESNFKNTKRLFMHSDM